MATTVPDSIFYPQGEDQIAPLQTVFSTLAASVQTAFTKRQRYSYAWSNVTGRNNQTGMAAGSTGYQRDTKTEYVYDGVSWVESVKYDTVWPQGTALPQLGAATNAPPVGTQLIRRIQYVSVGTDAQGKASSRINFFEPFPNAVMHITMTTIGGKGVQPVINSGDINRLGFMPIWVGTGAGTANFTYEAIGW